MTKPTRDIFAYEAVRRAEVSQTDWARLHIISDKRQPIYLEDRKQRGWRV